MPYSKELNILFIHIPKCAGKSFEVALGMATQEEVSSYRWRTNLNRLGKLILNKSKDKKALPRLWGVHDMALAMQHLTYAEIELLNLLDAEILNNAIKVAIVRNPYDRAVSSYHHMGEHYGSFLEFLQHYYKASNRDHNALAHKRPQVDFLRDKKGNIVVDNIIKLENINEDFKAFTHKHNLNVDAIPVIGKQKRKTSYKDYYCNASKMLVEDLFSEDFTLFNYTFE